MSSGDDGPSASRGYHDEDKSFSEQIDDIWWYYRHEYVNTNPHTISVALITVLAAISVLFLPLVILILPIYIVPIIHYYTEYDPELIDITLVPTTGANNRSPSTKRMRNKKTQFDNGEATVHASVAVDERCDQYRLRFTTPDPPVETELRGAALGEQTFEPPDTIRCDNPTTRGFDPIIDLYLTDPDVLQQGDHKLRVYNTYRDKEIVNVELVN